MTYQPGQWTITLNKYQRDNLLWLIMACGYTQTKSERHSWYRPEAFEATRSGQGDWMGELYWMLQDGPSIQPNAEPHRDDQS